MKKADIVKHKILEIFYVSQSGTFLWGSENNGESKSCAQFCFTLKKYTWIFKSEKLDI